MYNPDVGVVAVPTTPVKIRRVTVVDTCIHLDLEKQYQYKILKYPQSSEDIMHPTTNP